MPVPVPTPENQEPRRLLRDVVYDKMFFAILDGTLELGERLNDEELVRWLGVSRTPVREAIAKLAEQGLVDIEANRYTRVIAPTFAEFVDTLRACYDVWALIMLRGVGELDAASRKSVVAALDARVKAFEAHSAESVIDLDAFTVTVLEAAKSPMLARLYSVTAPMTVLLIRRAAAQGHFPWDASIEMSRRLRDAVEASDARTAHDLVSGQPDRFGDYYAAVRESGIYPA
ncbi:GntR family transcriptional regulator [Frondihabitans sp. PhB188]|uniref:GntR family transcriptional regulator n=1 Tax=Frondihabitans sp. PhB188 TaxID=2485200 RepID=UPI000F47AB88|nr:GntR family transcriptional regulator [Frondihabitans sp. PhB188]ROQ37182.1 GntR family transcriptional regulator [Frondihabitans sp. PhB188]